MNKRHDPTIPTTASVLQVLRAVFGARLPESALEDLAQDILPFLQRSTSPLSDDLIERIASNYLHDGPQVAALRAGTNAHEWQAVLTQVITFAVKHRKYPTDLEARSWPDIDAFEDIQRELDQYNFEGSFDSWVTVVVVRRLSRYWRDQQSLRSGGSGFKTRAEREAAQASSSEQFSPRASMLSLDQPSENGLALSDTILAAEMSIAETVESAELRRLLHERIHAYATAHDDPVLPLLWDMIVEHHYKLREAAAETGLSVSQVHRRIEQLRKHLQDDQRLRQWIESTL